MEWAIATLFERPISQICFPSDSFEAKAFGFVFSEIAGISRKSGTDWCQIRLQSKQSRRDREGILEAFKSLIYITNEAIEAIMIDIKVTTKNYYI